jgi:hypothetical protein
MSGDKWNVVIAGAVIAVLSLPRGTVCERFGAWE